MKKVDNSYLKKKVFLRLDNLNKIKKNNIKVLDCFSGNFIVWGEVKKKSNKKIDVTRIEKKDDCTGIYICGDNLKVLPTINLSVFDIIDLDAYGIPFEQIKLIFDKKYKGYVHVTFIQSGMGRLNNKLLYSLKYTPAMIKKAPTLFSKNGMNKMEQYLAQKGIKIIKGFFIDRKNYFYYKIE